MKLHEKFERKESFLFSIVQCDSGLQKTKIFLEKMLLWLCPRAYRSMPKIQGNRKEQQGIQVFMSYIFFNVFLLKPFFSKLFIFCLWPTSITAVYSRSTAQKLFKEC